MGGRIVIGAAKSGSGKTFLTCGLLKALTNMGLKARSYKCGPDYIDPMFHRAVLGIQGGNLDSYFSTEEEIRLRVGRETRDKDITVIEGVMGYYDGLGGNTSIASAYDIARITDTPAILIIDGKGMSLSAGALVKGFKEFREDSRIAAVIANRVGKGMESRLRAAVEEAGCAFLGCFPEREQWKWDSRHLGLMMPEEIKRLGDILDEAAEEIRKNLDIEKILEIAAAAGRLPFQEDGGKKGVKEEKTETVKIAVARDQAFCFYYQENMELLKAMGGEIVTFSPLWDKGLPEGTDGLLLGGGYPEAYGKQLAENSSMKEDIRKKAEDGMPIIGECGGFLYLLEQLEGTDGKFYPMAGILEGKGERKDRLVRFGYGEFTASDSCFLKKGESIKGHEFHYWDSDDNGGVFLGRKVSGAQWGCIRRKNNTEAGFPHFYYPSAPSYVEGFIKKCREYRKKRTCPKGRI